MDRVTSSDADSSTPNPLLITAQYYEGLKMGFFTVEGKDAENFLHRELSNEIRNLPGNSGVPVCLLNREGHIQLYFTLWKTETGHAVIVIGEQRYQFIPVLDRVIFREQIHLEDQTSDFTPLILAGAQAPEVLLKTGATKIPSFPYQSLQTNCGDISIRVYRMDWVAAPCFLLMCAADQTDSLKGVLEGAGVISSNLESFHSYRVEKGTPWPGYEVDETLIPLECGLENTISYTKGCYVGQDIIARIHNMGRPPRVLRGLILEGESLPEHGASVFHEQIEVGKVLSVVWSERLGKPLATTSIRVKYSNGGTPVTIKGHLAYVCSLPLI